MSTTPTDRELLEFAAKAAGKTRGEWDEVWLRGLGHNISRDMMWNPLERSGDTFELQVKLGLTVDVRPLCTCIRLGSKVFPSFGMIEGESDMIPATRRAITRAAYEIGKAMP